MRLKCPNCDAVYEVGEGVIPPEGRDVQCSNCANTWFQYPEGFDDRPEEETVAPPPPPPDVPLETKDSPEDADFEAALQAALEADEDGEDGELIEGSAVSEPPAPAAPEPEPEAEPEPVPAPAPEPEPVTAPVTDAVEDAVAGMFDDPASAPSAKPAPQRPPLDPDVSELLRAEAAREMEQRRHEGSPELETQPDLGLDEADTAVSGAAAAARARMERMRGDKAEAPVEHPSRRDLLPDIEEINSSLRSTTERTRDVDAPVSDDVEEVRSKRSGFRVGFILILLVAVLGFVAYAFAPQIIAQVPQAEPYLTGYIAMVNEWRLSLDALVQRLTAFVQSKTG